MTKVSIDVRWFPGKKQALLKAPDKVVYAVASITLDKAYPTIPMSIGYGSGTLRRSSKTAGVRGSNGNYYIGSYTKYAKAVYNMKDSTNWSTPGTHGLWYKRTFDKYGKSILSTAIERGKIK